MESVGHFGERIKQDENANTYPNPPWQMWVFVGNIQPSSSRGAARGPMRSLFKAGQQRIWIKFKFSYVC